jgi:hypothetical protein
VAVPGLAVLFALTAFAAEGVAEPPPITVRYTMPYAGKVTLAIDDAKGRRVRNLTAIQERSQGECTEPWDGRDDAGKLVAPGSYTVKGIAHQPLGVTYEGAVNVSDNPPWVTSWHNQRGAGGWLSDHAPPNDVTAIGDRLFISALVAEAAHGILACDLDGHKLWGEHRFGSPSGLGYAGYLAHDGGKVYTAGSGYGNYVAITEIDPVTFAARGNFMRLNFAVGGDAPSGEAWTLGGFSGIAARNGKLYLTFNGSPHSWTGRSAINAMKVDGKQTTLGERTLDEVLGLLRGRNAVVRNLWRTGESVDPVQHLRLAFTEPQAMGTLILPDAVEVGALKAEAAYPGDLNDDSQWIQFAATEGPLRVLTAPAGQASTRALRFTFRNDGGKPWRGALRGAHLLPRRFDSITGGATSTASSGKVGADGKWETVQETPITPENPATLIVAWPEQRTWRGLALLGALAKRIAVDAYTGPADVAPAAAPESSWKEVGEVTPAVRGSNYADDYFDAGRDVTSRAIRLRVLEPWVQKNPEISATKERPTRASLAGLVVLRHLGEDPAFNEIPPQRISIADIASGKWERHVAVAEPSWPTFDPQGRLLVVSRKQVVRLDIESGSTEPALPEGALEDPRGLAFDTKGNLYVADGGPNVVKVFAAADLSPNWFQRLLGLGRPRVIGEPGGRELGAYNPRRMENPQGIAIDARGNLWVAERDFQPKRVSVWSPEGKFLKEFIGPTQYGGGGRVDPRDPSRIYYNGMEFSLDYKSGNWSLKRILSRTVLPPSRPYGQGARFDARGQAAFTLAGPSGAIGLPDLPVYLNGRQYMVLPHQEPGLLFIGEFRKDRVVPLTVMGRAERWWPLANDPALRKLAGDRFLENLSFAWSDRNGDGVPQPDEVALYDFRLGPNPWPAAVNGKLEMQWVTRLLKPAGFTEAGAPIYRPDEAPERWIGNTVKGRIGDFQMEAIYAMALDSSGRALINANPLTGLALDGSVVWTYPNNYVGVQGSHAAPPHRPGQLVGPLWFVGVEDVPGIGEVFVLNSNVGEWYLFTTDGLFVANLWADSRAPGVPLLEFGRVVAERGMRVDGAALVGEHFGGGFQRADDGAYYLVAGKASTCVFRLHGLETMRRLESQVQVTADDLVAAEAWRLRRALAETREAPPKTLALTAPPAPVKPDGDLGEWEDGAFTAIGTRGAFAVRADDENLYVAWRVDSRQPLRNAGIEPSMLFTTGDSVDLQIGVNPDADPKRGGPVPGDQRLLVSLFEGKPIGVLYRHRVPGTPEKDRVGFSSPWRTEYVDRVARLGPENIGIARAPKGYAVEAVVPLELLGLKPQPGKSYKLDFGILSADSGGSATMARTYWANPNTGLVNDVPGEIQLSPGLWGEATVGK